MNNFFTRVAVIFVLFIIGYYVVSPYQNCVRDTVPISGTVSVLQGQKDIRKMKVYCAKIKAW